MGENIVKYKYMELKDLKKVKLPDTPGVYFFRDARRQVLYINKATSLREQVRNYFNKNFADIHGPLLISLIETAKSLEFVVTDSVLEALILETNLIKRYNPSFNIEKTARKKSNIVVITDEKFPRVLIVRESVKIKKKKEPKILSKFGPFSYGAPIKEAVRIVRKIFPFRDNCIPHSGKPCFNCQTGLCPGVCSDEISEKEYKKNIRNIKLFFEGKKANLLKILNKEMMSVAKKLEFKEAEQIKQTLFELTHIQDITLTKEDSFTTPASLRIEAYDIAHISGMSVVGVMVVVEKGEVQKSEHRKYKIKGFQGTDDTKALRELITWRFTHSEWQLPQVIVVNGATVQKNVAEQVLRDKGIKISVISVAKNRHHKTSSISGDRLIKETYGKQILLANNEAHRFALSFHRKSRGKMKW